MGRNLRIRWTEMMWWFHYHGGHDDGWVCWAPTPAVPSCQSPPCESRTGRANWIGNGLQTYWVVWKTPSASRISEKKDKSFKLLNSGDVMVYLHDETHPLSPSLKNTFTEGCGQVIFLWAVMNLMLRPQYIHLCHPWRNKWIILLLTGKHRWLSRIE